MNTTDESEADFLYWAINILHEINPSNYDHDDVCELNAASVEVSLAMQARHKALLATLASAPTSGTFFAESAKNPSAAATDEAQEREAFEKWADEEGYDTYRVASCTYASAKTASAWEGWHAARASVPSSVGVTVKVAREATEFVSRARALLELDDQGILAPVARGRLDRLTRELLEQATRLVSVGITESSQEA